MATGIRKSDARPAKAKTPAARKPATGVSAGASAVKAPSVARKEAVMIDTPAKDLSNTFETMMPAAGKAATEFLNRAQSAREEVQAQTKTLLEKNMKTLTEFSDFARGNVEALIESARAAANGAEKLTTQFVEASKKSADGAQAAFQTLSSARTPNEFIVAQNEFAKTQFDKLVAESSKFTEAWLKLAGEVVQPLSSRVAVAAENVKKNIAA